MAFGHFLETRFNAQVRDHLTKVYGLVGLSFTTAGVAAWAGLTFPNLGLLNPSTYMFGGLFLTFFGLLIGIYVMRRLQEMMVVRLTFLLGLAATSGAVMVPLLQATINVDPWLVVLALVITAILFSSLSMCALVAERGTFLFLGGPLVAFVLMSVTFSIGSWLFSMGHTVSFYVNVYLGLLAMCGFVLYDTQTIVARFEKGDDDVILHALNLFLDLISIFKRVLTILLRSTDQDSTSSQTSSNKAVIAA